ncbi:MAG TPA: glycosyltransferase family 4 protein [Candidatus Binatia bacterium]|nr:glycosyltransferase family 4 protein [Candidatus Binatia bacterium]
MRVLMLNERDLAHPLAGGVEVHVEEAFGRLAAAHGIATTVLCAGFAGGEAEVARAGMRLVRLGRNRLEYYARVAPRARAEIASGRYDLVVENLCKLVYLSPLWLRGVPGLALVHHLFGASAFRQVAPPIAAAVLATEAFLPIAYRRWPFVAVSPSTRDDLVRRGIPAAQVRVVPNGLDHGRYRPGTGPCDPDRVVFVGRVEHYKGVDVLVRGWPSVRAARPQARLEVVGAGAALATLRRRVADGGIGGVTFHGFASEDEKVAWLRRATVVVQPSRKEGWGLTVLEANACGAPVVAADVPGLRDSVRDGETGFLVPAGDPAGLGAAIARVLGDASLRDRLSHGALAWAARFRWDAVADELAAVLRAAAARTPLPATHDFLAPASAAPAGGTAMPPTEARA